MKRYSFFCIGFARRFAAVLACVLLLTALPMPSLQADAAADNAHGSVSSADAASEDSYFTRVVSVPANVYIPDFYQQVINVSGMYIFTMPDGTVYKRIYGAMDDVYGWYEPVGIDNIVPRHSALIDVAEDSRMYHEALHEAELNAMERQDYTGILPPDQVLVSVETVQGMSLTDLTFYCVAGAVLLCLFITIAATSSRSAAKRRSKDQ